LKIGDLVKPTAAFSLGYAYTAPVGLVIGENFSSYSGALLQVLWPNKAHPMWEPKQFLELVSETR
jgi:hypothetical protein